MSLDLDVSGAQEPQPAAPGEHQIRIIAVRKDMNKNDEPYLMPTFEVVGDDLAPDFNRYFPIPTDAMKRENPKKHNRAAFALKTFFEAFGLNPSDPGDEEDWKGLEAWAILDIEKDDEFGDRNRVKRFVTSA